MKRAALKRSPHLSKAWTWARFCPRSRFLGLVRAGLRREGWLCCCPGSTAAVQGHRGLSTCCGRLWARPSFVQPWPLHITSICTAAARCCQETGPLVDLQGRALGTCSSGSGWRKRTLKDGFYKALSLHPSSTCDEALRCVSSPAFAGLPLPTLRSRLRVLWVCGPALVRSSWTQQTPEDGAFLLPARAGQGVSHSREVCPVPA